MSKYFNEQIKEYIKIIKTENNINEKEAELLILDILDRFCNNEYLNFEILEGEE